jgi:hypothetical protein
MSSKSILKKIVSFVDVPAGETASLPHSLNIMGAGVIPDYLDCGDSQARFDITADDTNVILTNKSGAPASVDVLCEHWHSIPRQLRADNLSIQPFKGGGSQGAGAPVCHYIYRPGAVDEWAAGGNVYTDWQECFDALQSTKYLGTRTLEFDGRFSGEIGFANGHICRIPAGTWDMEQVDWTTVNRETWQSPDFLDAETVVVWDDFAFTPRVSRVVGNYVHDGELHSPLSSAPVFGDSKWVTRLGNTNPNAQPMLKIPDNTGFIIIILDNACQAVVDPFPVPPIIAMPAPVIDFGSGTFVVVGCRGADIRDNFFSGGAGSFLMWPAMNGPHNWDFPKLGFFNTSTVTHGGPFMDSNAAVAVGDFDAGSNEIRRIDSNDISGAPDADFQVSGGETTLTDSGANFSEELIGRILTVEGATSPANNGSWPIDAVTGTTLVYGNAGGVAEAPGAATYTIGGTITATLPDISGVVGEVVTLSDVGGYAGVSPILVDGPNTIEKPYLNRPFQSKTWKSQQGFPGTWLLVADSYDEFLTDTFTADFDVSLHSTNVGDSAGGDVAANLPSAASTEKGAIARFKNVATAGANNLKVTPDGGDTIEGVGAADDIGNGGYKTFQCDGVSNWLRVG